MIQLSVNLFLHERREQKENWRGQNVLKDLRKTYQKLITFFHKR